MEITEKKLMQLAGWECIKKSKLLVAANSVKKVQIINNDSDFLTVTGLVIDGRKKFVCGLKFKGLENVENLCRCSDSIKFGKICEHSIALILSDLKKFTPSLTNEEELSSKLKSQKETIEHSICPIVDLSCEKSKTTKQLSVIFEIRNNQEYLTPKFIENLFNLTLDEIDLGACTITVDKFLRILEASKLKHIEIREHFESESKKLIVSGSSAKIPIQIKRLDSDRVAIERNAFLNHTLYRNKNEAWVIDFVSLIAMPLYEGFGDNIDGESLVSFFVNFDDAISLEVSLRWLEANYHELTKFFRIELPSELSSMLTLLADDPKVNINVEGSLNSISISITFIHKKHPNPNFGFEKIFIENLNFFESHGDSFQNDEDQEKLIKRKYSLMINGVGDVLYFYSSILPALIEDKNIIVNLGERFYSLTKDIGLIKPHVRMTDSSSDWFEFEIDFQSSSGDLISEDEIRKLINKGKYSKKSNSNKRLVLDKDRVDELFHTLGSTETKQRISGDKVLRSVSGKEALYIEDSLSKFGFRLPELNNPFNKYFEKNFNGNLKSYQKEGVIWMNKRIMMNSGFILADEMGLGKTVQILALIASMNLDEEKVLIICPTSLICNWKTEVKKFLPESSIQLYHGIDRGGVRVDSNIVISTYGTLLSDTMELSEAKFSMIVADEASYFKNDLTKTFKALESIDSNIKIALSGTPIENEISDLWSLMNIVNPNYLGSKENFKDYYVQEKSKFRHRVSPFILRRLKKDVLKELPDKVEKTIFCDLSLEERGVYNNLLVSGKELISNLNKSPQGNETIQVLTLLLRLRQVCCDLRLIKNTKDRSFSSSKMNVLMNLIKNSISGGSKVIVFSQFVKMLKLIEAELKNESIPSYLLDGGTKSDDRNQMVKDFQDSNKCTKVFLISLKAGGYGLNLTAADTVIHFDPWWNPSVENQATDRVHRIGQSKIVNCYKLITNNTVEEKILSLQDKKRNLINMAIDEEVPDMRGLNNEDLKFVLN